MTRNKMPRWLSEGISVYEELQANPTWGQAMSPKYREMVLGDDLAPVGKLSAAFLTPKTDMHLQFAYYESSLVVEFLVERFGLDSLKKVLRDLATGMEINEAIAKHTAPLEKIEKDFTAFARERAQKLGSGLDWEKPQLLASARPSRRRPSQGTPPVIVDDLWAAEHTNNFYALRHQATKFIREKKWEEAKKPLKRLIELYPEQTGSDSAYALLAEAHRGLNETNQERQVLTRLAGQEADALDAYLRLMELSSAAQDWAATALNAERYVAVNPLVPQPYRYMARASEALDKRPAAIAAYSTLLRLDPPDPAEVHFRLARLLHEAGNPAAKRHVLQALEEAPRFREAHGLLLKFNAESEKGRTNGSAPKVLPDVTPPARP
jgi:tetratricopeptide (TPR) repeat protein